MNYRINGNRLEVLDRPLWRTLYEFPDPIETFMFHPLHGLVVKTYPETVNGNIWLISFDGKLKWQIVPTNDPTILAGLKDDSTGWTSFSIHGDKLIASRSPASAYLVSWDDGSVKFVR